MSFSAKHVWSLDLAPNTTLLTLIKGKHILLCLSRGVFLPHPDSLLLARSMKVKSGETVCDAGTGSGILAIIAAKLGASRVFASDINKLAIRNAKENSGLNGVKGKCTFRKGSWFKPFQRIKFDVVIANPPQIPGKGKEPDYFRTATHGGADGTVPTLTLLVEAKEHLKKGGRLYIVLKEWMDWKKVLKEMRKNYKFKKVGETFSPVWTRDRARLSAISKLVSQGKARFRKRNGVKYWRIYAFECTPKHS